MSCQWSVASCQWLVGRRIRSGRRLRRAADAATDNWQLTTGNRPMTPLPIDSSLPEITARLRESRSLVLVAPPGAGKTTRVPPAILRAGLLSADHPNLVMLQP